MPLKIRLLIKNRENNREVVIKALVNTGFTSDAHDIMIPTFVAEQLGFWPTPLREIIKISLETGGGVVQSFVIPQAVLVKILTNDRVSREVTANVIVNPYIDEVLISDYLAEELGIQILYPRRGIWKFVDEERLRESEDC